MSGNIPGGNFPGGIHQTGVWWSVFQGDFPRTSFEVQL